MGLQPAERRGLGPAALTSTQSCPSQMVKVEHDKAQWWPHTRSFQPSLITEANLPSAASSLKGDTRVVAGRGRGTGH